MTEAEDEEATIVARMQRELEERRERASREPKTIRSPHAFKPYIPPRGKKKRGR
jgi:hypothetical protein